MMSDWAGRLPIIDKSSGKFLWKPCLFCGGTLVTLALFVLAWLVLLLRQLGRREPVRGPAAAGAVV